MTSYYISQAKRMILWSIYSVIATMPAFAYTGTGAAEFERDQSGVHFLITSKEDYIKLTKSPSYWEYDFLQTADIDLGDEVVTPIGIYYDNTTEVANAFRGSYNGQGYTLKNAKILWDKRNVPSGKNDYSAFGLFGVITSNGRSPQAIHETPGVSNLVIENVRVTRSESASLTEFKDYDVRLAILAGHIDPKVSITNISIINCRIDAGTKKGANARSIFAAGVVADISSYYGNSSAFTFSGLFNNIYCNVDIDMTNLTRIPGDNQKAQAIAAGIVGRMRTSRQASGVPRNTVFTGTINAPCFQISPTVGHMRADTEINNIFTNLYHYYSGQFYFKLKSGTETKPNQWYDYLSEEMMAADPATTPEMIVAKMGETRYFTDYRIVNTTSQNIGGKATGEELIITDIFPPVNENNPYGLRTLLPYSSELSTYDPNNANDWAHVQGVNFGTYSNPSDPNQMGNLLAMLQSGNKTYWEWEEWKRPGEQRKHFRMRNFYTPQSTDFVLNISSDPINENLYIANVALSNVVPIGYKQPSGSYQWYSSSSVTDGSWQPIIGATSQSLEVSANPQLYYRCEWVMDGQDSHSWGTVANYRGPRNIIYVYDQEMTLEFNALLEPGLRFDTKPFPNDGDDNNNGATPQSPVKTMRRAYELLDQDGTWDTNEIVIMGVYNDHEFLRAEFEAAQLALTNDYYYNKPTTITGTDGRDVSGGMLCLFWKGNGDVLNLRAPLRLNKIDLLPELRVKTYTLGSSSISSINCRRLMVACNFCDFLVDADVRLLFYDLMEKTMGLPNNLETVPRFTLICGSNNDNSPENTPVEYSRYNRFDNRVTVELRSGAYARIICSGRNDQNNSKSKNITGSPDGPACVYLKVNIDGYDQDGYMKYARYGSKVGQLYTLNTPDKNRFTHDIGLISGGQTDGTSYSDVTIDIYKATVARLIAGNIAYGRSIDANHPTDSFFGRTVINIYDGTFNEMYGCNLGRHNGPTRDKNGNISGSNELLSTGFYGKSIINMYGGVLKKYDGANQTALAALKDIEPNIYSGGAGGIAGLGNDQYHTSDPLIPYISVDSNSNQILNYGPYDVAKNNLPKVNIIEGEDFGYVDLAQTLCEVNLYGGTIFGNVYGGGYGYSNDLKALYVPNEAGNLYGRSIVALNMQPNGQSPIVLGNIYGAGAGSDKYYTDFLELKKANGQDYREFRDRWKKYYGITDPNFDFKEIPFRKLAQQVGQTNVIINAGVIGDRDRHAGGKVFGGSLGIEGFQEMAALYGNTSVEVDGSAYIVGNVYGGSQMGSIHSNGEEDLVTGSTYVTIKGGSFGNCIFGGSEGKFSDDYSGESYNLVIEGDTHSVINGGQFTEYSFDSNNDHKSFNIYGGGYYNCEILGDANLNIYHSLFVNQNSLDPTFVSFSDAWNDILFRRFCVYGGGFGENATVAGNTNLTIDIQRTDVLVSPDDNKPFYSGKQFFDVCGGGYAGWVGNTNVKVRGNVNIRKVVGGGFYSWVGRFVTQRDANGNPKMNEYEHIIEDLDDGTGRTYTHIESGVIETVVGGSLLGNVHHRARTVIGTRLTDENRDQEYEIAQSNSRLIITGDVFGGNDVMGIVGTVPYRDNLVYHYGDVKRHKVYYEELDQEDKGTFLTVYGGTIRGSVYGAGNGYYRGYFVPGWGRYMDGPDEFYRHVPGPSSDGTASKRAYMARPTTGRVNLNISGNSETDRVVIEQNVYGGGKMCSIGQWHPYGSTPTLRVNGEEIKVNNPLHLGDPGRYIGGGELKMNFGSHVTVNRHVHMGADGALLSNQSLLTEEQAAILPKVLSGDEVKTSDLAALGQAAYDHWYWYQDGEIGTYKLGYPTKGTPMQGNPVEGAIYNKWLVGEHQFYAFIKNIEMNAKINLTFFEDPFKPQLVDDIPIIKEQPDYDNISDIVRQPDQSNGADLFSSKDIVFESFFLGGHAGFMTYEKDYEEDPGVNLYSYEIVLPAGLTVRNKVVSGAEDSWIKYYNYTDDSYTALDTTRPEYELLGGISVPSIFEREADGELSVDKNTHHAVIRPGKRQNDEFEFAMRLSCAANFQPILDTTTEDEEGNHLVYGGLIYGGCYRSGVIHGNVVLNVASNLLGDLEMFDPSSPNVVFDHEKSLKFRVGRVFGGGYGQDAINVGRTIVNVIKDFKGLNVFGGGSQGRVEGVTQVNYVGTKDSYIYGSIYGGGLLGSVGEFETNDDGQIKLYGPESELAGQPVPKKKTTNDDPLPYGSKVFAYAGNVGAIYGGSCFGDVYGGTLVYAADEIHGDIDNFEYTDIDWEYGHLVCGNLYGGNNVSGHIYRFEDETDEEGNLTSHNSTDIHIREQKLDTDPDKEESPGSHINSEDNRRYTGFPLIGNVYAGSNGNYGEQADGLYTENSWFTIANTNEETAGFIKVPLQGQIVPNIDRAIMNISGGTIINCFGGGDRSTVTERTHIDVVYNDTEARAGFEREEDARRLWYLLNQSSEVEFSEALHPEKSHYVHRNQIFRLFGGNNHSDMAIQPTMNLTKGHLGSVYSGGNIGRMTYYAPPSEGESCGHGLSLSVSSADIHIDAIYGGGRIGDIRARYNGADVNFTSENPFYGATLNISAGLIEAVYGGNDVSGNVYNGTNVNISGAISGDVYAAGNGNYLYYYDRDNEFGYNSVNEAYDDAVTVGRYFVLPNKAEYGSPTENISDSQVIMALNSYRPHVERSSLNIEGTPSSHVWVKGSVYCGGNSSTISSVGTTGDIRFNIGSHVTLNGVFLGSNGESLARGTMIERTEFLNQIDMTGPNTLETGQIPAAENSAIKYKADLYKSVLDLYMRAVEVTETPKDFKLPEDLDDAYIGEFCVGGNQGSMMTSNTIELTFPEKLVIYQRIIGGSRNASVSYEGANYMGGLTMPVAPGRAKVDLKIKCKFLPLHLQYPDATQTPPILLHGYMVDGNGQSIMVEDANGKVDFDPNYTGTKYYPNGQCVIYGGCFLGGRTVGDIHVDLYSDMLNYSGTNIFKGEAVDIDRKAIVDGINDKSWRAFDVIGAGYGSNTEVYGNVYVNMHPHVEGSPSPSVATIFGGSREGTLVGNTYVEVRDGKVLTNVYGGNESSVLYGSTHVIIGYPKYYEALVNGNYKLRRADDLSFGCNDPGNIVTNVYYRKGDYVPANVYNMIIRDEGVNLSTKFQLCDEYKKVGSSWDDIDIWIGDQQSQLDPTKPYYGHGNVYGGGFISNTASMALAGQYTVRHFDANHLPLGSTLDDLSELENHGGNSSVMIWDNWENAVLTYPVGGIANPENGGSGAKIRDHISISTGYYKEVKLMQGENKMGYFLGSKDAQGKMSYTLQSDGEYGQTDVDAGAKYYEIVADGGIYGGGRQVFVQCFSAVDLGYYGYADHTAPKGKLLNTLQRADVVTLTDCCLELNGASDFTHEVHDGQLNTTSYSINRVGELQMISSLDPNLPLPTNDPRNRNFMSFFRHVHLLSSFVSNWTMSAPYHGSNGSIPTSAPGSTQGYVDNKLSYIDTYYDPNITPRDEAQFKKRNVGTSANMIGLNSGYSLRLQGQCRNGSLYYGPVFGVTEVKLLTNAEGEGGGYIFALNHHYDPNYDYDTDLLGENKTQNFLHTTGNFVFASPVVAGKTTTYVVDDCYPMGTGYDGYKSAFTSSGTTSGTTSRSSSEVSSRTSSRAEGENGDEGNSGEEGNLGEEGNEGDGFNVNNFAQGDNQEIHYWYVEGTRYFYNVTITGLTNDQDLTRFYMQNHDNLIYLPGLQPGNDITIKTVNWRQHADEDFECDLRDLKKDYQLFFMVDKYTTSEISPSTTDKNGAYVAQIPRGKYVLGNDPETPPTINEDSSVDPNHTNNGVYSNKTEEGATVKNVPLLGIRLDDHVHNRLTELGSQAGIDYYNKHLADPDKVTVVMTNTQDDVTYEYTVVLNIEYLLGPAMTGYVQIENCALPGEYIYANANDVNVDMDQTNLVVTKRYWKLYPTRLVEGEYQRVEDAAIVIDPGNPDASIQAQSIPFVIEGNQKLIHIPAYYYQNGWEIAYVETAAGTDFEATTSKAEDVEDEHKRLTIHNYHRMKPEYASEVLDLRMVPGCRIYIEDQDDMDYWLQYIAAHQDPDDPANSAHTPDGQTIHPLYLEGLDFFLQNDVTLPELSINDKITFAGNFHGNGHHITINNTHLPLIVTGNAYNIGFLSNNNDDNTCVFNDLVGGSIVNCFYFSSTGKGTLVADNHKGTVKNCYQNTGVDTDRFTYDQLLQLTTMAFRYGQAAYNLNGFYLQKRHLLLNVASVDMGKKPSECNNPTDLDLIDDFAREDSQGKYNVNYIERIFNNGDYRYAYAQEYDVNAQFTERLRTLSVPNYYDRYNNRSQGYATGAPSNYPVSFHDCTHPVDQARWYEPHQMYRPNFDIDYLFFGQDLTQRLDQNNLTLPCLFSPETRVYRVGGFYSDNTDKGFFLNADAHIDSDIITAIDFVGYRDRELYDKDGRMRKSVADSIAADNADGWYIIPGKQEIFWAPTIDRPYDSEGKVHFNQIVLEDNVTHNLLIYVDDDPNLPNYDKIAVHNYAAAGFNNLNEVAMHDESTINAHIIIDKSEGPTMMGDYFHLVDRHRFWCPVAFRAKQAWYTRQPVGFSDQIEDKTAWEGICLPFTPKLVYAASIGRNSDRDHGEITHFYDDQDILHEYWLRRFQSVRKEQDGSTTLIFERPTKENMAPASDDIIEEKTYYNPFFERTYLNDNYVSTSDDFNHDAYRRARTMVNYRNLTASVPYIVTFPGERYYEFDLSGEFYASKKPQADATPQTICYMMDPTLNDNYVTVPVTKAPIKYTHDGYQFCGTFLPVETMTGHIAVQELYDPQDNNFNGTQFVDNPSTTIDPFRTYVVRPQISHAPLHIGSRAVEEMIQEQYPDMPQEDELEDPISGFRFYMDHGNLMIDAPYQCNFIIYNMMGQALHQIEAYEGTNRYTGLSSGFYIVHNFKFAIR